MRVLAILEILQHPHLQEHAPQQGLAVAAVLLSAHVAQVDALPAARAVQLHGAHELQVVVPRAGPDGQLDGRVALVEVKVDVEARVRDGHHAREVHRDDVRLRPVRLPEGGRRGVAQRVDAAAGLGRGHGPRREGRDVLEPGRERRRGGCACASSVSGRADGALDEAMRTVRRLDPTCRAGHGVLVLVLLAVLDAVIVVLLFARGLAREVARRVADLDVFTYVLRDLLWRPRSTMCHALVTVLITAG